jgi:hypothetical protein
MLICIASRRPSIVQRSESKVAAAHWHHGSLNLKYADRNSFGP